MQRPPDTAIPSLAIKPGSNIKGIGVDLDDASRPCQQIQTDNN